MENVQPLDAEAVRTIAEGLKSTLDKQRIDADNIDSWINPGTAHGFRTPPKASREHKALADLARTPWLGLVVTNVAQAMYVDNVVGADGAVPDLWRIWLSNNMQAHQVGNHRAMVAYGHTYGVVMPATDNGVDTARMRCLSPRRMACRWVDAGTDLYPEYALEVLSASARERRYRLYGPHFAYSIVDRDDAPYVVTEVVHHGVGVTPVVRFANMLDLDGHVVGEVVPFIPTASRINKTSYDRLLAQHFNSWKVRTIAGMDLPMIEDDPDAEAAAIAQEKMRLAQEDILISEDADTKFGTLDATSLDTFVTAWRADIEALAAVSQTPAHALTGQLVNLNAEALAAARSPLTQKVYERQVNAGASYGRMLRLAASVSGMDDAAADDMTRVTWQDMEIRSMSQAVDALGKAASMLKIPARGLWNRIPGVERSDVQEWERLVEKDTANDPLTAVLRRHSASSAETSMPTTEG